MLFNSTEFLFFFLPVTLCVFFLVGASNQYRLASAWIVGSSLFFYAWWNTAYLGLILGSILFNYFLGLKLVKYSQHRAEIRKWLLTFGVVTNLGLLAYFKYTTFLLSNLSAVLGLGWKIENILLPLAISFFSFQQIAYLVEAYRGQTRGYSFLDYALFVSFFPQLIAGPIVYHKELIPQFWRDTFYRISLTGMASGLGIFFIGLIKKVVLADGVSIYSDPVFDAATQGITITFFEAWAAALAFTFQIYFDFSGYSDMAIGLAAMIGITLPLNFQSPYKAVNIIQFWKNWHMTLSRFLRDHVYIPLGGNRKGNTRRYLNLFITMLLGGLWHGAGWTFIAWGALHGFYLVINHGWLVIRRILGRNRSGTTLIGRTLSRILTFAAVLFGWVFFRAENFPAALEVIAGLIGLNGIVLPQQVLEQLPFLSGVIEGVGEMPLLGGGYIMGLIEMAGLFLVCAVVITMPATQDLGERQKLAAILLGGTFALQKLLFSLQPVDFIYFQF